MCILGVLAASPAAAAQPPPKVPRVGVLCTPVCAGAPIEAFLHGLHDLGYFEGRNIAIEYRAAQIDPSPVHPNDPFPDLVGDLLRLKVDLIVASHPAAIRAAKNATKTVSIVMVTTGYDPVETGLINSLARPGGNITGAFLLLPELGGKRLELIREAVPGAGRIAILWDHATGASQFREAEASARALRVQLQPLTVQGPEDLPAAFRTAVQGRAGALVVVASQMLYDHRMWIAALAVGNRMPAISPFREFAEAGGLMAYGANLSEMHRRAAYYVDKILKGAKPADLPVEQPMRFELVINLRTAKALSLTIPRSLLSIADEVIQ